MQTASTFTWMRLWSDTWSIGSATIVMVYERFLTHIWSSWLPSLWVGVFALKAGVNPAKVKKVCSLLSWPFRSPPIIIYAPASYLSMSLARLIKVSALLPTKLSCPGSKYTFKMCTSSPPRRTFDQFR